mmetsp:Transcript_5852/g.13868  ORF Transcript_5852/g.13868 Transcript_5852/m.13868 type:complete len:85 (+) Transcript_5852:1-255(+)
MVLMPVFACVLIISLRYASLFPSDRLLSFVLLLEAATPTAINLKILCALHKFNEKKITTLLFFEYLMAALPLTIWISLYLIILI